MENFESSNNEIIVERNFLQKQGKEKSKEPL